MTTVGTAETFTSGLATDTPPRNCWNGRQNCGNGQIPLRKRTYCSIIAIATMPRSTQLSSPPCSDAWPAVASEAWTRVGRSDDAVRSEPACYPLAAFEGSPMSDPNSPEDPVVRRDRREHGGAPFHPDDDALAARTERERVDAGLEAFDEDDVPPATDAPSSVDITDTAEYQEADAEVRRQEDEGELYPLTD